MFLCSDQDFLCTFQLAVLASLGERFPQNIDDDCVRRELIDTNMKLQQLLPTSLYRLPILNDPQKKEAMVRDSELI